MIEFNILGLEMHVYTWVNVNLNFTERNNLMFPPKTNFSFY